MVLNINTDAAVQYTVKLEKLHKSALPNAIRNTLNSAAFDVKKSTMPQSADTVFEKRQPNFFKANSRVDMAKGWDMNSMKSTVGFVEGGLKGGNNYAVKDLEEQEGGGSIGHKTFIPLRFARQGNKSNKPVRANARLSEIKNITHARDAKGKNKMERFVKSAIHAGKGGHVLSNGILWKINSIKRLKSGNTVTNKTPLYTVLKNRSVNVSGTKFMMKASLKSAEKLEYYYRMAAQKEILRLK
ncbi:MAG: hypothetical protein K0S44_217 [Bacteroidetes bacterium]|jgi:hypothetical protein|nr:hypothetical protein [Bacteroidota bacterium]